MSYSYGVQIGKDIARRKVEGINPDILAQGLKDAIADDAKFSEDQMRAVFQAFDEVQRKVQDERNEELAAEGVKFLEENKLKEGVMETESGLQYKVIQEGMGTENPAPTDEVTVHYTGKLIDGTVFDSSVERGEPISFPLNGVIAGWTEGLQLMTGGAKYEFYIPSELGYGPRGAGADIPPNAVLIFEVELISIQKK